MNRRRVLAALGAVILVLVLIPTVRFGRMYYHLSHPVPMHLTLPAGDVAADTSNGAKLLAESLHADHDALMTSFQSQEKLSWCGVASGVTVLGAKGEPESQDAFFTPEARAVRSWYKTTFGGMTLADFAAMMRAHGAAAAVHYASEETADSFRAALSANLADPTDWLVVNYHRPEVGEKGGGHISPIAAYDPTADMALLLDVSAYKYPPHWVPAGKLFDAMNTTDSDNHRSRGWVDLR